MALGRKTGGRVKGVPNKVSKSLRDDIFDAYHNIGGVAWLENLAHDDPRTFAMLIAKILPTEINAELIASGQILFKTMYESQPEALPAPVVDLTADIIEADVIEPEAIELTPSPAPSSPE